MYGIGVKIKTWPIALAAAVILALASAMVWGGIATAIERIPDPDPIPGSYGIEVTKKQDPPTVAPRITIPANGATFTEAQTTVRGTCPRGLLIEVYDNDVMVGAVMCADGTFNVRVSLFPGANQFTAIAYDSLEQPGPRSNSVTVTYRNTSLVAFADQVTLTTVYGRRSAPVNSKLVWPLQLAGGTGPYALSIDWGDGGAPELMSRSTTGNFDISHIYKKAGIYQVNILATDSHGVSAFLQVIAVASGVVDSSTSTTEADQEVLRGSPQILWVPYIILLILLLPTYWLGRRSQLVTIRNKLLKERDSYSQEESQSVDK